ncbi:hypothetical protein A4S06_09615 [Erysipelotrichaceae bacterium MTC7]|nr:hypothetical protein A4S06_09615 [Erysipelotrichaceae bacterium MTC7]
MRAKQGFTLLEALVSLLIVSILVSLVLVYLQSFRKMDTRLYEGEDDISISQLRLIYVLSEDVQANGELTLTYFERESHLQLQKDRLVMQPGYQVFLQDLDDAYFEQREECIYLVYQHKKQKPKERIIGC